MGGRAGTHAANQQGDDMITVWTHPLLFLFLFVAPHIVVVGVNRPPSWMAEEREAFVQLPHRGTEP